MVPKKKLEDAVKACLEDKGKRKFTQSIDLAINFAGIDFKKPENRLSLDVALPVTGKKNPVAVFADGEIGAEAKKSADLVISSTEIPDYASDKKKQRELFEYTLLASSPLMPIVGKQLGQVLGGRGKLPRPIMPGTNVASLIDATRRTVSLKTKGKYLPSVHCAVGMENMSQDDIINNINTVLEAVEKKIPDQNVSSIYIKTTMGKPVKVQ